MYDSYCAVQRRYPISKIFIGFMKIPQVSVVVTGGGGGLPDPPRPVTLLHFKQSLKGLCSGDHGAF